MHPLEIALRRIDGAVAPRGKDQAPSLWVLYWDEEKPDRIRTSRLALDGHALASESAQIGPAQKLLMFARSSQAFGLDRVAPENWCGWAFHSESWFKEALPEEKEALVAAGHRRQIHLMKGRREVRIICGAMRDGSELMFMRFHDDGTFDVGGVITDADGNDLDYVSGSERGARRFGGDTWRGLRALCGRPEGEAAPEGAMDGGAGFKKTDRPAASGPPVDRADS